MRTISKVFVGFVLVMTGIWLVSNPDLFAASSFISLRHFMVQYSGFLAISMMSLILLLSVRPVWLTRRLGGLDKAYRLHKWLGIAVLVVATLHWAWRMAPKWGVALGLWNGAGVGHGRMGRACIGRNRCLMSSAGWRKQLGSGRFILPLP